MDTTYSQCYLPCLQDDINLRAIDLNSPTHDVSTTAGPGEGGGADYQVSRTERQETDTVQATR